jgi:SAM-dependent methyltransferase
MAEDAIYSADGKEFEELIADGGQHAVQINASGTTQPWQMARCPMRRAPRLLSTLPRRSAILRRSSLLMKPMSPSPAGKTDQGGRLRTLIDVEVACAANPSGWPDGHFDLIVLSEIGYYLERDAFLETIDRAAKGLSVGGTLLASHWRHPEDDYLRGGDEVHRLMAATLQERLGWSRLIRHEEEDFLVEVWSADARSISRREGLRP